MKQVSLAHQFCAEQALRKLRLFLKDTKPVVQKFHRGDVVFVARDLGISMRHFTGGCYAVVEGSYADLCTVHFHGTSSDSYGLILIPDGRDPYGCSWYYESQLTLVKKATQETRQLVDLYSMGHDDDDDEDGEE